MNLEERKTNNQIPLPDWNGTRIIYKKLSEEFQVLTNTFNLNIDQRTKLYLDHLIIAIDEIDNYIDELPSKEERDAVTHSLVDFLLNEKEKWIYPKQNETLPIKIENLKRVIQQLDIKEEFSASAKTIFYNTEIKRHTKKAEDLIQFVTLEGKATAILPLSIMQIKSDTPFGIFFTKLCMLMGIVDLIIDARQDFKKEQIALQPNFKLYYQLFKITIIDGLNILISIPRKLKFMNYCFRFSIALLKG